jgi:hypothetical protein
VADDRILLLPPGFAPDPAWMERMAAPRAALQRMREVAPVDIFRWPWLRGQEPSGGNPEQVV